MAQTAESSHEPLSGESYLAIAEGANPGEPPTEAHLTDCLAVFLNEKRWDAEPDEKQLYPFLALCWHYPALRLQIEAATTYWSKERRGLLAQCVEAHVPPASHVAVMTKPVPQTATALLDKDIPPLQWIVERILPEGLILFGGKSKRGKSWLALDIAMSVAAGRCALQNPDFAVRKPRKVLYIALEDGKRRIQHRLRAIQPNIAHLDNLMFAYDFPLLTEGGIALLHQYITEDGFELIIIDVLAKVEGGSKSGKSEKAYQEVYDLFAPLIALKNAHQFSLLMLTHLRKQEAEDVFEMLHGSVAYQGAQDLLWVMERKPDDDVASLYQRGKDAEDLTLALRFTDGHWTYIGEGESHMQSVLSQQLLAVLKEEDRRMSIKELMQAGDIPSTKYAAVRQCLKRLADEDMVHRLERGMYAITWRAAAEGLPY